MNEFSNIEPKRVWEIFYELSQIPRPSGKEEKIREWAINWAEERELSWEKDDYGNLVITKKAAKGYEHLPGIVMQGHFDMVCEKEPEVEIDFDNDPIDLFIDGEYVTAKGTTLGADNGIAIAMAFAFLEENIETCQIEVLLTVEEETGLFGATNLNPEIVKGRNLLNLDSEEWGTITIGCAGGGDSVVEFPVTRSTDINWPKYKLTIGGLHGGHSGIDIDKNLANALKLIGRFLYPISSEGRIVDLNAGNLRNAISRDGEVTIALASEKKSWIMDYFNIFKKEIMNEWEKAEPNITLEFNEVETQLSPLDKESTLKIARFMVSAPHGVIRYSPIITSLVETSTNFAISKLSEKEMKFVFSTRSSVMSALEATKNEISSLAELIGVQAKQEAAYPGWEPNIDNNWFKLVERKYTEALGSNPKVEVIHAGLETGAIGGKIPEMMMVAFGPEISGVHSPSENVEIVSVAKIYSLVKNIVIAFSSEN
ncbi:MAG: aminoacyl-histidine dipeptidase [Candidatus Heimdallarchaeota archaeon]|nr:aminoacyl-histidine dipeptidase [Candidatus Heimdallarchaeota archaeon]MCK5049813.1 aminoacyl-histidine dipeptidase [Candidatus Heimdallarchaeota archaeon]